MRQRLLYPPPPPPPPPPLLPPPPLPPPSLEREREKLRSLTIIPVKKNSMDPRMHQLFADFTNTGERERQEEEDGVIEMDGGKKEVFLFLIPVMRKRSSR